MKNICLHLHYLGIAIVLEIGGLTTYSYKRFLVYYSYRVGLSRISLKIDYKHLWNLFIFLNYKGNKKISWYVIGEFLFLLVDYIFSTLTKNI